MHPVFTLKVPKGIIAFKLKRYCFNPGNLTGLEVKLLNLIAFFFAPHDIHTHKHGSPVTAFGTTGTCSNLQYSAKRVTLIRQHILKLKVFYMGNGLGILAVQFLFGSITFLKKFV